MTRQMTWQNRNTLRRWSGVLALLTLLPSTAMARGGHGGHGGLHHSSGSALTAPGAPSVPPSLTPDARLTGQAPLPPARAGGAPGQGYQAKLDPEDAKLDKMIKNICRGC